MNTDELREQQIINDLKHSLKLMPSSQRELFAAEVSRYIQRIKNESYEQGYKDGKNSK